jgi:hypothetical protein
MSGCQEHAPYTRLNSRMKDQEDLLTFRTYLLYIAATNMYGQKSWRTRKIYHGGIQGNISSYLFK